LGALAPEAFEPPGMLITYESSGEVRSIGCSTHPSTSRGM
jgi:hypothetical protein